MICLEYNKKFSLNEYIVGEFLKLLNKKSRFDFKSGEF